MSRSSAESGRSSAKSSPALRRFFDWLEVRVAPYAHRIGDAPAAIALREALPWSFVGLAVGLVFFTLIGSGRLVDRIVAAIPGGFAVTSVTLVVLLALAFARRLHMPPGVLLPTTIVAFALTLPRPNGDSIALYAKTLGASGLFLAIVVAAACAAALEFGRRRKPGRTGYVIGAGGIIALAIVAALFDVSLAALLAQAIEPLGTLGDSFFALFLIAVIETGLWVIGIHGPALLAAVVTPIYLKLQAANFEAFSHGHALPHIVTVSTFLFVFPGGAGATLGLLLILLRSRVPRLRKIAYATLLPGVVNTNEPLILGVPLVFSPIFAIPFVVAPALLVVTTYVAMALGFVGRPVYYIPSPVPAPIAVVLATRDWRAAILEIINIAIAAGVYWPFVRLYERTQLVVEA